MSEEVASIGKDDPDIVCPDQKECHCPEAAANHVVLPLPEKQGLPFKITDEFQQKVDRRNEERWGFCSYKSARRTVRNDGSRTSDQNMRIAAFATVRAGILYPSNAQLHLL